MADDPPKCESLDVQVTVEDTSSTTHLVSPPSTGNDLGRDSPPATEDARHDNLGMQHLFFSSALGEPSSSGSGTSSEEDNGNDEAEDDEEEEDGRTTPGTTVTAFSHPLSAATTNALTTSNNTIDSVNNDNDEDGQTTPQIMQSAAERRKYVAIRLDRTPLTQDEFLASYEYQEKESVSEYDYRFDRQLTT
jgi:hypothetical protein